MRFINNYSFLNIISLERVYQIIFGARLQVVHNQNAKMSNMFSVYVSFVISWIQRE